MIGLYWTPATNSVSADFFSRFSMRMSHSKYLPDDACEFFNVPFHAFSGLPSMERPFDDHVLEDPRGGYQIVHPASLGYRIDPNDLTTSITNRSIFPFPMNRGTGELRSFTWRDTSVLAVGGATGPGVPMDIEVGTPLFLANGVGSFAGRGRVPSIGLPLLWEINTFPSSQAVGLNSLAILYPCIGWPTPHFRSYSTGGTNTNGRQVVVDPALEEFPKGGFNPSSRPPGQPTRPADNSFYVGQLDYVVRLTRVHSAWFDTEAGDPIYEPPLVTPDPEFQPAGTRVVVEFRGAEEFLNAQDRPFDALRLDAYGNFKGGSVRWFGGREDWTADLTSLSGARFLQMRLTFEANVTTFEQPEVDSVGIAYRVD